MVGKRAIALSDRLAYYLLKGINKAIRDYHMIADGDRIAVAVSGGKDSLTLLHLLRLRQRSTPGFYETVALHLVRCRPDGVPCASVCQLEELEAYMQSLGQAYVVRNVQVDDDDGCFRCARLRRRALFTAATELGCNKLALGHHADDAAETTLLNLFFHGTAETMQPSRTFFDGQLLLIRPMIYLQEKEITRFAATQPFPKVEQRCPNSVTSRRALVKALIASVESEYPKVKINLFRAGLRENQETADPGSDRTA